MADDIFGNALILTGPTGSGKSQLALELAEGLGAEIIAMDSMTGESGALLPGHRRAGTASLDRGSNAVVPQGLAAWVVRGASAG
jgi:dephospho-CoA kinase